MALPAEATNGALRRELRNGWQLVETAAGAVADPQGLPVDGWMPALVPGTVAGAVATGHADLDSADWWFRLRFDAAPCGAAERLRLRFDGLATLAEVFLNGLRILSSRSMFAPHVVDVSDLIANSNELVICCRALAPELAARRRPRARWRTALANNNLRFFRTMLLGRAPGFAPGPAVVGPWRPVTLERSTGFTLDDLTLRPRISDAGDGKLGVRVVAQSRAPATARELHVTLSGPTGRHELAIALSAADGVLVGEGELQVPAVARWWPHTHGEPTLYDLVVTGPGGELQRGRIGFRALAWPADWEDAGFSLKVNGVELFARGALWTPLDLRAPHQPAAALRQALEQVTAAGMNMLRLPGIGCYESDDFYDLCDELGVMVWQDFMLANLDYPAADADWAAAFEQEARTQLRRLAGRPSLAVLCGGSEVAQQVTMLGLDPALARDELYTDTLPRLIADAAVQVPYVPNSPWGGELPFRPGRGVANYYGVGAYLRPLSDARLAEVKFASECLAFSNVPDESALAQIDAPGGLASHHPAWKAGIPRDAGAGWDFEDVRDHYLKTVYAQDPIALRHSDPRGYLDLSRAVTGEVMADVFGEWRRGGSRCAGGLVLWLRDLLPGAGWGLLDHRGQPKAAYHHIRRALAPVAVWTTDEGLNGMTAHVANDRPHPVQANLRISLYRRGEVLVHEGSAPITLSAHSTSAFDLEAVLGRFADVGFAYRFGPPNHDVVVASLETGSERGAGLISQAFRYPAGWQWTRDSATRLGVEASVETAAAGATLRIVSRTLIRGVRIEAEGWSAADDAFTLEPGVERHVPLRRRAHTEVAAARPGVCVTALNMADLLRI